MAKTTIRSNLIDQAMADSLKQAGIQDRAALDKLMATTTIEKVLSDAPAVYNYFKMANLGLESMVYPQDQREVRGAVPTPDHYREYFDNQISQPTPYFNFIPAKEIFNPELLAKNAGFTPEQTTAYRMIVQPPQSEAQAPTWDDVSGQGGGVPASGGTGKAMSTSGVSYGGTGKALSTGGNSAPQTKTLGAPPPPPGMGGGGGYVPPPPGSGGTGGTGGTGGYTDGLQYGMGSQGGREWVDQNIASNDPNYGWFQQLFGRSDMTTSIVTRLMDEQARDDQTKQKIMTELQNLDPSTPEGARQITLLNYQMQEINNTRSERMDKMMTAKKYQDELITMVKGMVDIQFRAMDGIVKNMRQ